MARHGAAREHHRYFGRQVADDRGHVRMHVAGAHPLYHHPCVAQAGQRSEQAAVVAHGGLDERHRCGRAPCGRQGGVARHAHVEARLPFDEGADRPDQRREKRRRQGRVRLLNETRRVNVVVEDRERPEAARLRACGHDGRRQEIGGPVRAGRVGAAHGTRHDHRLVGIDEEVEQESRFLDGVGALDHHRAVEPGSERLPDRAGDVDQVRRGERRAGQAEGRPRVDVADFGERRHRRHELGGAQLGRDASRITRHHGDRPAERQDEEMGFFHGRHAPFSSSSRFGLGGGGLAGISPGL